MNIHVSKEIIDDWPGYEFRGLPFLLRDGKKYIRAYSKCFNEVHYYCFQDNWFWHEIPRTIPLTEEKSVV